MHTLLFFDIGNDKLRNKIIYLCQEANLSRIQFSVFMGYLDEYEKEILIEKLNKTLREYLTNETPDDKHRQLIIHIIPLCNTDTNKIKILNRNGITHFSPLQEQNLIII